MGSYDEEALERVVASPARYVSLVASRRRAETVFAYLEGKGVPPDQIHRVKVPAGLDIGAVTPEEIALSILAEIVQNRHRLALRPVEARVHQMAIDPICGMSVDPATAQHTAEFQGVRYYFCSAHCRRTFEREPATYAPAGA
ncbi:MAG: XdhC family protein, partial [bacterium]